jgi:hypothetical protein
MIMVLLMSEGREKSLELRELHAKTIKFGSLGFIGAQPWTKHIHQRLSISMYFRLWTETRRDILFK